MSEGAEFTTVIQRHIKPGREKEYAEWFGRLVEVIKKHLGYRGLTSVVPRGTGSDDRIVL